MDTLPVVVKKGRHQLEDLAKAGCQQRWLCPHGKLLTFVDSRGALRVHDLCSPGIQRTIDNHRYISCLWINKTSSTTELSSHSPQESFLLAVTSSQDIHLYSIQHVPALYESEGEGEDGDKVALLPFKQLSSMTKRQITNMLSKAQLGTSVKTLSLIGSYEVDIVLLANNTALIRLSSHSTSHQLNLSAIFNIEPNMEQFQDDLLPHYVGGVSAVCLRWPLLFTVTEDGIVLIYNVVNANCIAAVNPLEYCRMYCPHQPEVNNLLQTLSSSTFKNLAVTPDLMKVAVATDTHHILTVNLPIYFTSFPDHYSKTHRHKPTKRSPQSHRVFQNTSIAQEEEQERLQYGGITKRHKALGVNYLGSFAGQYAVRKHFKQLSSHVDQLDLSSEEKYLSFAGSSKLQTGSERLIKQVEERKWYMSDYGSSLLGRLSGEDHGYEVPYVTSMKKFGASPSTGINALNHTPGSSLSHMTYPIHCILPSPDSHVTADSNLLHLDYNNSIVVAYYNENGNQDIDHGTGMSPMVQESGLSVSVIVVYKVPQRVHTIAKLPRLNWLILPVKPDKPVYLVSESSLSLAAFTMSQEDFVAKVLMYGSAAVAEEVCHLNHWDQCSLPLNALETALQLRQLDIVSFFLRNRGDNSDDRGKDSSLPVSTSSVSPLPLPPEQLDAAVELLTTSIKRNHNSEHNRQYAGQLLGMTLNFLLRIIKSHSQIDQLDLKHRIDSDSYEEGTDMDHPPNLRQRLISDESGSICQISLSDVVISPADITSYIHHLRQYLPRGISSSVQGDLEERENKMSEEKSGEFSTVLQAMVCKESWQLQSAEEIIQRALTNGKLPLAQAYLVQKAVEWEESPHPQDQVGQSHTLLDDVTLTSLTSVGVGLVMKALSAENIKLAISYINQMGADVKDSLHFIFLHTVQRQLRDFLAEELVSEGWLSSMESDALDYLHILESYYPMDCYESAKVTYNMRNRQSGMPFSGSSEGMAFSNNTGNVIELYPEYFGGDQAVVWEPDLSSTPLSPTSAQQHGLYIQVPMYVVLEWDSETRQRVLFDALVLSGASKDFSHSSKLVYPNEQLLYQLTHHNLGMSLQLVPHIEPEVVNQLVRSLPESHLDQYSKDIILDELARHGFYYFPNDEHLTNLLYWLSRQHNLFSQPHPLYSTDQSGALVGKFHHAFVGHLINVQFIGLLYLYLDYFKLALDRKSIHQLGLNSSDIPPWVQLLVQCRLTGQNPTEPENVFLTSLSCSRLLFNCSSVNDGLKNGHLLMSLAILMYAPASLTDAMDSSNAHEAWFVDENTLRQVLGAYPTLQAAIFPSRPTKLTPAQSQDITVYELLKGTVSFDISRLFKWQRTNKIAAADEDIEAPQEPPHFSQSSLCHQYAQTDKLSYIYYLYEGQPSFAFANFVAAKLANRSNLNKRIDKAVSQAYRIGISDFSDSRLVSTCVAFIEMLSRDSANLRLDTQAAMRICNYLDSKLDLDGSQNMDGVKGVVIDPSEQRATIKKKIATQFLQLYQSPDNYTLAGSLLHKLEKATAHEVMSNALSSCGVEAENFWVLVQMFCQYHSLPPTTAYLVECAKEGEWLSLLCHSQLYGIATTEVLFVVEKYFSDPRIKEHLQLAISTIETTPPPPSPAFSDKSGSGRGRSRSKRKFIGGLPSTSGQKNENDGLTPRDVRANFYSKVGLVNQQKPQEATSSPLIRAEPNPMDSLALGLMSPVTEVPLPLPITEKELPEDLLSVLFQCQDHTQPWRALLAHSIVLQRPLLALLAAYYPDSCILDCMCVWLCATVGSQTLQKVAESLNISKTTEQELHFSAALQWRSWTVDDLGLLFLAAILETPCPAGQFPLMFQYFDDKNPLIPFMRFHEEFILRCDLSECRKQLNEFALQIDKCGRLGYYPALVGDSQWVEEVATTFANRMLVTCPTPFERAQLLKLLAENGFGQHFVCQILNFSQLYQISSILDKTGLSSVPAFKITDTFSPSPSSSSPSLLEMYNVRVRVNCENILRELVDKGQFTAAREYAKVAEVPVAEVTLKEVESKHRKLIGTSYWQYQPARISFWQQCHRSFIIDHVSSESAAEFFESVVKSSPSISPNERTLLLVLALIWRKEMGVISPEQEKENEREIWLSHLRAVSGQLKSKGHQPSLPELITDPSLSPTLHPKQQPATLLPILLTLSVAASPEWSQCSQVNQLILADTVPFVQEKVGEPRLNQEESDVLDTVIGRLLNAGWLSQARDLAILFEHDSPDLTIVLLAQRKLSPDHLTQEVLDLLANQSPRRFSSPMYVSDESGIKDKVSIEIIRMLQQLSDRATHAHKCCQCIISCFKISVALKKSYSSVVTSEVFDTLAELLSSLNTDKYTLAKSFVDSSNIQPKEMAGFLSDCIAASLQSYMGGEEHEYSRVKVYEPNMSTSNFMSLAQLCQDHALLGSHLLSMTNSLASSEHPSEACLSIQVEMLIRAHDCYSLCCSVDGIGEVLKVAREITTSLYQGKYYKLMVRLLTGVGRFHEMSYIIHLLLECDEFESLVHHGVEKVEQLRVALMDYLRKNCKHDHEKRQMVALKFGMFRELAKTREDQAMRDIKKLEHKNLSSDSIQILKRIFADLRDASKIYAQNNCLSSAEHCLSQARLVALQLSLLQSGKQILNMDTKGVHKFMEEQPFTEALIVADAYKQTLLADWVNPLYRRVILAGDTRYLNEFRSVFPLSPSIIQELASRYLLDKARPPDSVNNMKRVLTYCTSLTLKHKLVHQLGLHDVTGILDGSTMDEGFLKDLSKL